MFFSDRIKNIERNDRVLEIGPGGSPHPRADIFLDLDPATFKDEEEALYQRGSAPELKTKKAIVYYDGKTFPFNDNEFDYVICSHVLEHVLEPENFLNELFRVAKKGYIEYPTILYDYIYNIPVHHNFLYFNEDTQVLSWMRKKDVPLEKFEAVQAFYFLTLNRGYDIFVQALLTHMMQGFEWEKPFKIQKVSDVKSLVPPKEEIKYYKRPPLPKPEIRVVKEPITNLTRKELLDELKRRLVQKTKRGIRR